MAVSLQTPVTLGTSYTDSGTLGPFQEGDELVFQFTGGPIAFQFGSIDPTGAVHFDNQEVLYPPGTWAFKNLKGIRFRSIPGQTAVSLQAATLFFQDDPEPFTPGNVPGSVALTSTLNFQHNDIFVASEPTVDFEDGSPIVFTVSDDNANARVKVTPVFNNAADKSSASPQVFTGDVVSGNATLAIGSAAGSLLHNTGTILSSTSSTTGAAFETTVVGDTTAFRFQMDSSGKMNWGPGNAVADTTLSRLAASVLGTAANAISTAPLNNGRSTAGVFLDPIGRTLNTVTSVTNATLASAVVGDTGWRISVDLNLGTNAISAGIVFGTGTGVGDTQLYRAVNGPPSGTNVSLATNQNFWSTGGYFFSGAANSIALSSYFANTDSQPAFEIFSQGTFAWGPGGSSTLEFELGRVALASGGLAIMKVLKVNSGTASQTTIQNDGNIFNGFKTTALAATSTYAVDACIRCHSLNFATAGGTVTISNPTNPPDSALHTGVITFIITPSATAGETISWGTQYVGSTQYTLPASVAAATVNTFTFMADYTSGSILWRRIS